MHCHDAVAWSSHKRGGARTSCKLACPSSQFRQTASATPHDAEAASDLHLEQHAAPLCLQRASPHRTTAQPDRPACRLDALTADETDPETKLKLRRFGRGLKDASEDVLRCREILRLFEAAPAAEHETMVAGHHEDLGKSFFEYVSHRVGAADGDKARQEELIELATRMSALCEAFDSAQGDEPALQTAVENFRGLLEVRPAPTMPQPDP